jgi:hypothetical protein
MVTGSCNQKVRNQTRRSALYIAEHWLSTGSDISAVWLDADVIINLASEKERTS